MGEKGAKQRHQTGERRQACHKRNGKNCNQISKEQQKWKAEPLRAAVTEKETPEVLQLEGIWWGSYTERRVDNQRREGSFWKRYIKAGMSWDSQLREAAVVSTSLTARAKYKKTPALGWRLWDCRKNPCAVSSGGETRKQPFLGLLN